MRDVVQGIGQQIQFDALTVTETWVDNDSEATITSTNTCVPSVGWTKKVTGNHNDQVERRDMEKTTSYKLGHYLIRMPQTNLSLIFGMLLNL